jgi:alpha-N-acetylglucosamine transferase
MYTIDESGNKKWYNLDGKLHRDNDLPAIESANGKYWFVNGKQHRLGGLAAIEYTNGAKY